MRLRFCLAAIAFALAMAQPAWAQRTISFTGVDPTKIVNQPIDTSMAGTPVAAPQTFNRGFKLTDYLPHFAFFGNKPVIGHSNFPTYGELPGRNYLKAFGYNNFQPIK